MLSKRRLKCRFNSIPVILNGRGSSEIKPLKECVCELT
jgi:hypothetical protein